MAGNRHPAGAARLWLDRTAGAVVTAAVALIFPARRLGATRAWVGAAAVDAARLASEADTGVGAAIAWLGVSPGGGGKALSRSAERTTGTASLRTIIDALAARAMLCNAAADAGTVDVDTVTAVGVARALGATCAAALDDAGTSLAHETFAAVDAGARIDANAVGAALPGGTRHVVARADTLAAHTYFARRAAHVDARFFDARAVHALVLEVAAELTGAAAGHAASFHAQLADWT